jgi:hypothetical protein
VTAGRKDITIERGADFQMDFPIPDGIDLTWADAAMQFRAAYGFPTALLSLTTITGQLEIMTSGTGRWVRAKISAVVAAAIYAGTTVYDLKVKEASGKQTRIWQGFATISDQVTEFDFPGALKRKGGRYLLQRPGNGRILLRK